MHIYDHHIKAYYNIEKIKLVKIEIDTYRWGQKFIGGTEIYSGGQKFMGGEQKWTSTQKWI